MSNEQISIAARRVWLETSNEAYPVWIATVKARGLFWGAADE